MNENKEVNTSNDVADKTATTQNESDIKSQSNQITKYEAKAGISTLNLFDDKQLASAEAFLSKVMKSNKGGITSVADGLAVLMRANDLNLPFSTCIEHIHVINGKTGIDIHIVKALLSRAGCTWNLKKDYQPLYEYTDGINVYVDGSFPEYVKRCKSQVEADANVKANPDGDIYFAYPVKWYRDIHGNVYKDYQLNTTQFGVAINKAQMAEITNAKKTPVYRIPNNPIDFVTEYEITRKLNGKEITATGRFSYNEAVKAEMLDKDTYKKYPRILIGHRAFTYAAREIASDILFGVSETTELKIINGHELSNQDTYSVEDADVVIIN